MICPSVLFLNSNFFEFLNVSVRVLLFVVIQKVAKRLLLEYKRIQHE
jgi:hypothetical protein